MNFAPPPVSSTLIPIQKISRVGLVNDEKTLAAAASSDLHGNGHMGVGTLDRVILSLESGIDSEISFALSTLLYYSCNEPTVLLLPVYPLIGNELIAHFMKPYLLIADDVNNLDTLDSKLLSNSVESLLSLRNAVQDLQNQQWLCQSDTFRKHALTALKFFNDWLYMGLYRKLHLSMRNNDLFIESYVYLLDTLDVLTCFYVENRLGDPLFAQLLVLLVNTTDKHALNTVIKCLYHQLFLGGADALAPRDPMATTDNCIDALKPEHLTIITRLLFVDDDDLVKSALAFLKQYLFSEAVHPEHRSSVKKSQQVRLQKLVYATGSKSNLHILLKQLPELIVAKLPLVNPSETDTTVPLQLALRSPQSVPAVTSRLPPKLYDIIITFPEPLRATTWLRCCYESPKTTSAYTPGESADAVPGEVTQISLWKAYENQFEAIWKQRLNPNWPNLLPAVDFIKNVSTAFPNSEAMVVTVPTTDPSQPPKKKFIIKGIQPRQHPVNIDVANFEALRKGFAASTENSSVGASIGDVNNVAFEEALRTFTDLILYASDGLPGPEDTEAPWYSPINILSRDILDKLVEELLDTDTDGQYKNIFTQYNKGWLPDLVFYNPGLVDRKYIDGKWLQYLL